MSIESAFSSMPLIGVCEINMQKMVDEFDCACYIIKRDDCYRVEQDFITRKFSASISEKDALELIGELDLAVSESKRAPITRFYLRSQRLNCPMRMLVRI